MNYNVLRIKSASKGQLIVLYLPFNGAGGLLAGPAGDDVFLA